MSAIVTLMLLKPKSVNLIEWQFLNVIDVNLHLQQALVTLYPGERLSINSCVGIGGLQYWDLVNKIYRNI